MKSMSDKKLPMGKGNPKSDGFFPEGAHVKVLPKAGEVSMMRYPDTEDAILNEQNVGVKDLNKAKQRPGYRH